VRRTAVRSSQVDVDTVSARPAQALPQQYTPAVVRGWGVNGAVRRRRAFHVKPRDSVAQADRAVPDELKRRRTEAPSDGAGSTGRTRGRAPAANPVRPGTNATSPASSPKLGDPGASTARVLALANQKGGVGKTTTTVNLGAALADLGKRVLVVDLDPQGNASTGLGIEARNFDVSIYDVVLRDVPLEDCIEPTSIKNLFVAPSTINLAGAEIELVPAFSRELRLRRAVDPIRHEYDYVLIDCPPSLGLLTVNGLAAASEVMVPIQCEYYALEGLGQLLRNVDLVRSSLNPELFVSTIVLTMYDARTKLADQVVDEVRTHFGDVVCKTVIPRSVRISEAPSFGEPVTIHDPSSRGALAYRELAREVSSASAS